ncbi:hypothetical protein CULC809_00984 [Corynebacterium ulcerans 809]|nr:hypothetical protein CULC809_00984 [Corynebacterium ulcerans 809]
MFVGKTAFKRTFAFHLLRPAALFLGSHNVVFENARNLVLGFY